jgi:hypothetical protein
VIRNGINESLITTRSRARSNQFGLLARGTYEGARTHVRNPNLNRPQSLGAQPFPV